MSNCWSFEYKGTKTDEFNRCQWSEKNRITAATKSYSNYELFNRNTINWKKFDVGARKPWQQSLDWARDVAKGRLPTRAEWKTIRELNPGYDWKVGYRYPAGNDLNEAGWWLYNSANNEDNFCCMDSWDKDLTSGSAGLE